MIHTMATQARMSYIPLAERCIFTAKQAEKAVWVLKPGTWKTLTASACRLLPASRSAPGPGQFHDSFLNLCFLEATVKGLLATRG